MKICQFEQQPKYPRCEKEATCYMITRVKGGPTVKHRYCEQHRGFVTQQLKGTYVRIVKWSSINQERA
jgi:hypothetical protein